MNDRYKFLIVGAANTAITFVIYAALVSAGVHYNLALPIVYVIGIALGFVVNRSWTFAKPSSANSREKQSGTQLMQYILVYVLVFLLNLIVLNVLVQQFGVSPIVAQFFALCISTVCSYSLQKLWVFRV